MVENCGVCVAGGAAVCDLAESARAQMTDTARGLRKRFTIGP